MAQNRPATPGDLGLAPNQEFLFTAVIMDGRVLEGNLRRVGRDRNWLQKQLEERDIHSPRDVFLALCDDKRRLTCYRMDEDKPGA